MSVSLTPASPRAVAWPWRVWIDADFHLATQGVRHQPDRIVETEVTDKNVELLTPRPGMRGRRNLIECSAVLGTNNAKQIDSL